MYVLFMYMCVYMYIFMYVHMYVYIYTNIYRKSVLIKILKFLTTTSIVKGKRFQLKNKLPELQFSVIFYSDQRCTVRYTVQLCL